MEIYELNAAHWRMWRDLRLRTLEDSGEWFAPRALETAQGYDDARWWEIAHDVTRAPNAAIVAVIAGEWIGCMRFAVEAGQAWLHGVWVDPRYRGGDVADEMLAEILEYARQGQFKALHLSVFAENARAIEFYKRHGFVALRGRVPLECDGEIVGYEQVMVKRVRA